MLPFEINNDAEAAALLLGELRRFVDQMTDALEDLGEAPPRSVTRVLVDASTVHKQVRAARARYRRRDEYGGFGG